MIRIEQQVQKSIIKWLDINNFLYVVPDAGVNVESAKTRAILKQMGRRAGAADIIIFVNGGTLCVEVKRPKSPYSKQGVQSKAQKEFQERIEKIKGHKYIIVHSLNDFLNICNLWKY